MKKKEAFILVGSFLLCVLANYLRHGKIFVALLNSLALIFSIIIFQNLSGKNLSQFKSPFIILLGAIPLFHFDPRQILVSLFQILILLLWFLATTPLLKNQKTKNFLFLISLLLLFWGSLISTRILSWPFNLDKESLIFFSPLFDRVIARYRDQAMYFPFQLRLATFSPSTAYLYSFLRNIAHLLSFQKLYDILLIANLCPLFWGVALTLKSPLTKNRFLFLGLIVVLTTAGINKSPDIFNSASLISFVFIFLILAGLEKINPKIYAFLLFLSLIIATGPKL